MKKRLLLLFIMMFLLSGCLFPQDKLSKNEIPDETQIETVQNAVDEYREMTGGLVPIKTKDSQTPIFEKYIIDFHTLQDKNLLGELPGNAFENGGYFQYALVNPEDDPTVKLIDVRIANVLQSIYVKLNTYQSKHTYLPLDEHLNDKYFTIDYTKLDSDEQFFVTSPYSNEQLPVIIDTDGQLYVDYRADLFKELDENESQTQDYDDIRYVLVDNSPFIPIYSPTYKVEDEKPILHSKE